MKCGTLVLILHEKRDDHEHASRTAPSGTRRALEPHR